MKQNLFLLRNYFVLNFLIFFQLFAVSQNTLPNCPSSPNCFRSETNPKNGVKQPMSFQTDLVVSRNKIEQIVEEQLNAFLVDSTTTYLHFEVVTGLGGFKDDLYFYFDLVNKKIHFKSASRVGYGDFGANKRRVKRIKKAFNR